MDPYKKEFIKKIKMEKKNKPLIFIHTPKCAGSYLRPILKDLNIKNNGHHVADPKIDAIYFTVIRDPIKRFESLLNYRLDQPVRPDWPQKLLYVYDDDSISLNKIIKKMTDGEIQKFSPYKTLKHWTQNVDVCI